MAEATDEKITRELASRKNVIFFPQTQEEYAALQKALFDIGFRWPDGASHIDSGPIALKNGFVLLEGKMYPRGDDDKRDYATATLEQALPGYVTPNTSVLQKLDQIMGRIDKLEKKVDALQDELLPKDIDKPVLKAPASKPQTQP